MWCLLPLAYFLLALGVHALGARLQPAGNRVRQFLVAGGVSGLLLLFHLTRLPEVPLAALLAGVSAYAFACELYIFLFTFVVSSVSVALLMARIPPAGQAESRSLALSSTEMVAQRLEMLNKRGLLDQREDHYHLNPRSRMIVACHRGLRRFFCHDLT